MNEEQILFNITFCQTNLRWLNGDPPSEKKNKAIEFQKMEIERLTKLLNETKDS